MKFYVLVFLIIAALYWGRDLIRQLFRPGEEFSLYLVVKDQEVCLEGIIRTLFHYLREQETSLQMILLVEESFDQTLEIAKRLARSFFFEVRSIKSFEQWLASNSFMEDGNRLLLDLRGKNKGWAEARKIKQFIDLIKEKREYCKNKPGLGV